MGRLRFWRRGAPSGDGPGQPVGFGANGAVGGRTVVVHYHLFKNAGSSVDATLQENFGARWVEREQTPPSGFTAGAVARIIRAEPEIIALSSHSAQLPAPIVVDCTIVPVVFVRHPLDRLRSIYEFERRQVADTPGAQKAKQLDLTGYLEWRLTHNDGRDATARSFQAQRLAGIGVPLADRRRLALNRIAELDFVGLVEEFEASINELQRRLVSHFPNCRLRPVWENASDRHVSLEERLGQFKASIPADLHERLLAENADDLAVWAAVVNRYRPVASGSDAARVSSPAADLQAQDA
jgi:hypothetical protein